MRSELAQSHQNHTIVKFNFECDFNWKSMRKGFAERIFVCESDEKWCWISGWWEIRKSRRRGQLEINKKCQSSFISSPSSFNSIYLNCPTQPSDPNSQILPIKTKNFFHTGRAFEYFFARLSWFFTFEKCSRLAIKKCSNSAQKIAILVGNKNVKRNC